MIIIWPEAFVLLSLYHCFLGVRCLNPAPGLSPQAIISSPELAVVRLKSEPATKLDGTSHYSRDNFLQSHLQKHPEYVIRPAVGRDATVYMSVWRKTQPSNFITFQQVVCSLVLLAWWTETVLICCPLAAHYSHVHEQNKVEKLRPRSCATSLTWERLLNSPFHRQDLGQNYDIISCEFRQRDVRAGRQTDGPTFWKSYDFVWRSRFLPHRQVFVCELNSKVLTWQHVVSVFIWRHGLYLSWEL